MIFADLPIAECEGALLVHALRLGDTVFRKGHRLTAEDLGLLTRGGYRHLLVVRLGPDDIPENDAAAALATLLTVPGLKARAAFTGRANLFADRRGLFLPEKAAIDGLNAIDEALTLATLPAFTPVAPGDMVATIKIIPFALARASLAKAETHLAALPRPALDLRPFRPRVTHFIQTELPGLKPAILEKTERVMRERLAGFGQDRVILARLPHEEAALSDYLRRAIDAELLLVMGASAIADRRDVIPAAIEKAGGRIERFGMPVDPGNLMLLGSIGERIAIGLPGCARSPQPNGCDWVMARLFADLAVDAGTIRDFGVGGLLPEIAERPMPRSRLPVQSEVQSQAQSHRPPRIAGLILAAGRASRMGENKLLLDFHGEPILFHVVAAAIAAGLAPITIVLGHEGARLRRALDARFGVGRFSYVAAERYADGMAESLKAGIAHLAGSVDAAMILLGDMPLVSADLMKRMMAAFAPDAGRAIILPEAAGRRGHPVLLAADFFTEIAALTGDIGAKPVLAAHADLIHEIAGDETIFADIDSPDSYRHWLARPPRP